MEQLDLEPGQGAPVHPVPVTRLHPSTRVVERRPRDVVAAETDPASPDPSMGDLLRSAVRWRWVIASTIVGLALSIVLRDTSGLAFVAGFALVALHWFDGRLLFSFADGIIGRKWDLGWPRGVQEDDDFTWSWSSGRS